MNWDKIYKLPLRQDSSGIEVYDANGSFVFQFGSGISTAKLSAESKRKIIETLNGSEEHTFKSEVFSDSGYIITNNWDTQVIITIRGWGNLTGTGGYNLPAAVAASVQDTFTEWIIETLNKRVL